MKERSQYLGDLHGHLTQMIGTMLPREEISSFNFENCANLIGQAAKLADCIRSSSTNYRFQYPFLPREDGQSIPLESEEVANFVIMDERSGRVIRNERHLPSGLSGRIGDKLCVVYPALLRMGRHREEAITVTKSLIIVRLDRGFESGVVRQVAGN